MSKEQKGDIAGVKQLDVLSIGEILVDFISEQELTSLVDAHRFIMYPGGEAANVALNASRLGGAAAIVARVGDDSLGVFLRHHLAAAGVDTTYLHVTPRVPTTLVLVTRHLGTPDFAIYRGADAQIVLEDMPFDLLPVTSFVHASAFALSREPSCSTVLSFIARAHAAGCRMSFDPNYHPRLWELNSAPLSVFAQIYPYIFVTKPSFDDCVRLFGEGQSSEAYAARFLELGVQHVVLTMGKDGVLLANAEGMTYFSTPVVEVIDITGAGDSFWAGMLLAIVDGYAMPDAVRVGQAVAAIKIQQEGPLHQDIDRAELYAQLGLRKV